MDRYKWEQITGLTDLWVDFGMEIWWDGRMYLSNHYTDGDDIQPPPIPHPNYQIPLSEQAQVRSFRWLERE
jgi:hypothetical protein